MAREAPEIRLIRESLEGVLHPSAASTLFFEAMQARGGDLPQDPREALDLVNGPLRDALREKLGPDGEALADHIGMMLASIGRVVRKRPSRHDEATRAVNLSDATMAVFILTSSDLLVAQLHASVGPKVITPVHAADHETLIHRLDQLAPSFVLIDASEFPAIEPDDLAQTLERLPSEVVKALWGSDLPYGQGVMAAAHRLGFTLTPFDRREGIEPVIDVIRSRKAPTRPA